MQQCIIDPEGDFVTLADTFGHVVVDVERTEAERTRLGLPVEACVAYGDSISDAALFATLPNTVAVNADPALEAAAAVAYRGDDLREAYTHARTLLDTARPAGDAP